jgi:hypothetical protein
MSKRLRFIIILILVGLGISFIYPTFQWYFNVPQEKKLLAGSSREQIREYAQAKARKDLDALKEAAAKDPNGEVPEAFKFLVEKAKEKLQDHKTDVSGKNGLLSAVLERSGTSGKCLRNWRISTGKEIMDLKDLRRSLSTIGVGSNPEE